MSCSASAAPAPSLSSHLSPRCSSLSPAILASLLFLIHFKLFSLQSFLLAMEALMYILVVLDWFTTQVFHSKTLVLFIMLHVYGKASEYSKFIWKYHCIGLSKGEECA